MKLNISKANRNDLEAILLLQKECYITEALIYDNYEIPPLKQNMASMQIEFERGLVLKATIHGEIIGSVRGFVNNGTCYIEKLIVKNSFQNIGIGKILIATLENKHKECDRFELFTGYRSQKNLYLYNKLGYKEFKREKIDDKLTLVFLEKNKENQP